MSAFTHFKEEETRNVLTGKSSTVSNLSKKELRGLKFLKARIKGGELIVGQTDKSSRFCVLTRDQYVKLGLKHTQQDEEIEWKHVKTLQNRVNNVVWWLSKIVNQSVETDESRMQRNIQDHNTEIADMYLLFKDHKQWCQDSNTPVPSRPVVSGNKTYNVHLSELLAELLEPVAKEAHGAEIASTEDALAKISSINDEIAKGVSLDSINALGLENEKYGFRNQPTLHNPASHDQLHSSPPDSGRSAQLNDTTNSPLNFSDADTELIELLSELQRESEENAGGCDEESKKDEVISSECEKKHYMGVGKPQHTFSSPPVNRESSGHPVGGENVGAKDGSVLEAGENVGAKAGSVLEAGDAASSYKQEKITSFFTNKVEKSERIASEDLKGSTRAEEFFTCKADTATKLSDRMEYLFKASDMWRNNHQKKIDMLV